MNFVLLGSTFIYMDPVFHCNSDFDKKVFEREACPQIDKCQLGICFFYQKSSNSPSPHNSVFIAKTSGPGTLFSRSLVSDASSDCSLWTWCQTQKAEGSQWLSAYRLWHLVLWVRFILLLSNVDRWIVKVDSNRYCRSVHPRFRYLFNAFPVIRFPIGLLQRQLKAPGSYNRQHSMVDYSSTVIGACQLSYWACFIWSKCIGHFTCYLSLLLQLWPLLFFSQSTYLSPLTFWCCKIRKKKPCKFSKSWQLSTIDQNSFHRLSKSSTMNTQKTKIVKPAFITFWNCSKSLSIWDLSSLCQFWDLLEV